MNRKKQIEFKLYLGTAKKDAATGEIREIDPERLSTFIETTAAGGLTGFTVINALGCWERAFEGSMILIHLRDLDCQAAGRAAVKKIAAAYKAWFDQDAVYLTENTVTAELL